MSHETSQGDKRDAILSSSFSQQFPIVSCHGLLQHIVNQVHVHKISADISCA